MSGIATPGEHGWAPGTEWIDAALVRRLLAAQHPRWCDLPIRAVRQGWDHRTFRLGDTMCVRLPSGPGYAPQVDKEHRWLPVLAPHLPLPIPQPLALGTPSPDFPLPWSVYGWIDGEPARPDRIADPREFAGALADVLLALNGVDPTGGPPAGPHTAFRGAPLDVYAAETARCLEALRGRTPTDAAAAVWSTALAGPSTTPPVWFHGDVAPGNLLVRDGRLCAVIDFGCAGVGDPACDLAIAWTLLDEGGRETFRARLDADRALWARGRGWALWKALLTLADAGTARPDAHAHAAERVVQAVIADHRLRP